MLLEKQSESTTARTSASLLSLVPRSVVLARHSMTPASNGKLDHQMLLLQSICRYLKANGFSKTVKKLKSEANFVEDEFTDTVALDLEDLCHKFLETSNLATMSTVKSDGRKEDSSILQVPKKKKKVKVDDLTVAVENSNFASNVHLEPEGKTKEKKRSKKSPDTTDQDEKAEESAPKADKLQKSKKEKKQDSDTEVLPAKTNESNKRKQVSAGDDDSDQTDEDDKLKEATREDSTAKKSNSNPGATYNNNDVTNSNNGDKSSGQRSAKKPRHGSAESTTLKAFQRVKVDEVVIRDERLKDNSYWAKDGAESGYGAKAQEILGQVRGKDFRHEKTKKKRGSYRGGQIDFNSHSIKFNDSDDE